MEHQGHKDWKSFTRNALLSCFVDTRRSMKCFHGWWSYLKLALPSVGACCLEWCDFTPDLTPACRTPYARHWAYVYSLLQVAV